MNDLLFIINEKGETEIKHYLSLSISVCMYVCMYACMYVCDIDPFLKVLLMSV